MNSVTIAGHIAATPHHERRGWTTTTGFDIDVSIDQHRTNRFHIVTYNDLAHTAAALPPDTHVAITGTLRTEPHQVPDGTIRHDVEILAYELDVLTKRNSGRPL